MSSLLSLFPRSISITKRLSFGFFFLKIFSSLRQWLYIFRSIILVNLFNMLYTHNFKGRPIIYCSSIKNLTEKLSMSMKNYIICTSQGQSRGFCETFQVLKGWNYSYSTFCTNSEKLYSSSIYFRANNRKQKAVSKAVYAYERKRPSFVSDFKRPYHL